MTYFRASLNESLEWCVNVLAKQWCKALKGGARYLWKRGAQGECLLNLP